MIAVPVKTRKGVSRIVRTRVPRTRSFDLYRKAEDDAPELLKQIYATISRDVEARSTETIHRSTDFINQVPEGWPYHDQWLNFSGSEAERRSLFEQVLWTFFFDLEEQTWETSWPTKDQPFSEYVRQISTPSVARARTRKPKPNAKAPTGSVSSSRGIEMAPAARASTSATDQLSPGDIVEIIKGRYQGLKGEITKIEMIDGFESVTVKLPGDDEYYDVPNFPTSALKKL
jgi:hypothetical protein